MTTQRCFVLNEFFKCSRSSSLSSRRLYNRMTCIGRSTCVLFLILSSLKKTKQTQIVSAPHKHKLFNIVIECLHAVFFPRNPQQPICPVLLHSNELFIVIYCCCCCCWLFTELLSQIQWRFFNGYLLHARRLLLLKQIETTSPGQIIY